MITVNHLTLSYDSNVILDDVSCDIQAGSVTILIGKNGCGKSTLLRSMARLLKPTQGQIYLNGEDIYQLSAKEFALQVALLSQSHPITESITVEQLVRYGRYPYHHFFSKWTQEDEYCVERALFLTQMHSLAKKTLDSLSGGQRQRAWIAMVLAQNTPYIFMDEPTTYLDLSYQLEVLDLLKNLNQEHGKTIVMVLHDLNLAARYADTIIAVNNQRIEAVAPPEELIESSMIKHIFGLENKVIQDPIHLTPLCIPLSKSLL
ncbi:ABC transporter ATP-binding protein [Pelistega europaea]|uniref:ABC transporter ATP-binding protein n=1 Tax=Pelistega europaea TaxID=106147 RepID=A0A7Y4L9X2_9BURK|nr:ABC transporter ATP-binding protein [Pelistega europaea]NOL49583.1 ABC transporter ATP-binding protein [Pelistega europaea]